MSIQPLRDISLACHTTMQLGGRTRYFYEATTESEVVQAVKWSTSARVDLYVLGGGSNLVVAATGLSGLVLKMAVGNATFDSNQATTTVRAGAGMPWDELVKAAVARGLSGVECLSGIPGTVGATPIQNVGAYGQEIAESLTRVDVYDRHEDSCRVLDRDECEFAYRDSRFKSREPHRFVILGVEFELRHGAPAAIRHGELTRKIEQLGESRPTVQNIRDAVMALRHEKGMLVESANTAMRSAGSFFVNPIVDGEKAAHLAQREGPNLPLFPLRDGRVKLSAGWLIENSGFSRGQREGNVGLSPFHCLVVVAHGHAVADDVVAFAHRIREAVHRRFNVVLMPEPNFWGFDQLDAGLPILDDCAPPTLGSASQQVKGSVA